MADAVNAASQGDLQALWIAEMLLRDLKRDYSKGRLHDWDHRLPSTRNLATPRSGAGLRNLGSGCSEAFKEGRDLAAEFWATKISDAKRIHQCIDLCFAAVL
ncbi:hypothetical protein DWG18_04770 [Lysobacter sp. TY2-98]|nr:hypothetical protein DWG18_04770 [Lysobacter sp. TY2-98]